MVSLRPLPRGLWLPRLEKRSFGFFYSPASGSLASALGWRCMRVYVCVGGGRGRQSGWKQVLHLI